LTLVKANYIRPIGSHDELSVLSCLFCCVVSHDIDGVMIVVATFWQHDKLVR